MDLRVAILQTGSAPESLWDKHGDYDAMSKVFLGYDANSIKTYNVQNGELPNSHEDYSLYLITGSPKGVYDGDNWIAELEDFIRRTYLTETKMIGVCFGHQVMAQALGGTVKKSHKGYGLGMMEYKATDGRKLSLCAWHQDQVEEKPEEAEIILSSDFCPIAGLYYPDKAISFQPHPEFSKAFLDDLIDIRRGQTITDEEALAARASLARNNDFVSIQAIVREFLMSSDKEGGKE